MILQSSSSSLLAVTPAIPQTQPTLHKKCFEESVDATRGCAQKAIDWSLRLASCSSFFLFFLFFFLSVCLSVCLSVFLSFFLSSSMDIK